MNVLKIKFLGAVVLSVMGLSCSTIATADWQGPLCADSSKLCLDVSQASKRAGAVVLQWYYHGGNNQQWIYPDVNSAGLIRNVNSGHCLATDGIPGHQLFQWHCDPGNGLQQWRMSGGDFHFSCSELGCKADYKITNVATGLVVDVYGYSYKPGAAIDAWYPKNGAWNQSFCSDAGGC